MRRTQAERDQAKLQRRLEVLKLPVVPLEHHGFVMPSDRTGMQSEPEAVGVGPDGTAFAVWSHRQDLTRKQVTWHLGGKEVGGAIDVETDLRVSFVQPLPEGRVLLAAARAGRGAPNGAVWTRNGDLEHRGHLGDAIEELLTTPSGKVWAGYFDEAMGGSGPVGPPVLVQAAGAFIDRWTIALADLIDDAHRLADAIELAARSYQDADSLAEGGFLG